MGRPIKKVLYFTNVFPSYRKELWKALISLEKIKFNIYFSQKEFQGIGASSIDLFFTNSEKEKLHSIKNINLFGHLIWQRGVLWKLISEKYDSVIFLGDMKLISNWLGIFICKIKGKKTGLWTHGIYGNEKSLKKRLRLLFLSLADNIFLYENRAREILIRHKFPINKLHVVYNSINLREQSKIYKAHVFEKKSPNEKYYNLVYFGRLTKVKKIDLAINAVIQLHKTDKKYKLRIVGNGSQEIYLKKLVLDANAQKFITFENAKYSENEIGQMFMESDLLISPGNVGLNAVHAMTYGTPVLTHGNFNNQMPESQIIVEGFNGLLHREDDLNSIQEKLIQWFSSSLKPWDREKIRNNLIKYYDPIAQAKIFELVLN